MDIRNIHRSASTHLRDVTSTHPRSSGGTHVIPVGEAPERQEAPVHSKMPVPKNSLPSRLWIRLKKRKRLLAASALWALVIILIVIKVHWFHYLQNPRFSVYGLPLSYRGPQMGSIDFLILGIASVLIAVLFSDESILLSYVLAFAMSSVGLVVYVALYIWFVLGWGEVLSLIPGTAGLELVIFWGILNVEWIMFPGAVLICLFGGIAGAFLRSWVKP